MIAGVLISAWIVLGSLFALVTLPGTVELLFLTLGGILPASRPRRPPNPQKDQRLAIVIPAHNEEAGIAACVRNLRQCDARSGSYSVVVVADNCSDGTVVQAQQAGATVLIRDDESRRGKGYALDYAFTALGDVGYDLFIVVDADSSVTPNLVQEYLAAFAAGADALQCRYKVRNVEDSARTRWMNVALMAFNVLRPRGRDRCGVSAGILGNGFALSRQTLERVPYTAVSLVEDLEYHLRLVRAGLRVRFVDSVTVYGEMPIGGQGVATQRTRWEGGRFRMIFEFAPGLMREVAGGKLRLLEPLLELLLLPLAFHVGLLLLALTTPQPWVRLYAVGSLLLVVDHLLAAVVVGGGSWRDAGALLTAPLYVIWKLRMLPVLLRNAGQGAAWVRTERNAAEGERP
jgi:cellulose synthase/poly-beta-1,6-N-acetylglucosamine synthase-like glycosyltransferase